MAKYAPGTFCWVDLGTPDLDGAIRFYTGVFGWEADRGGPEMMGYTVFRVSGHQVAGVGPLPSDDQPSMWLQYVATDDADATANRVVDAGGSVLVAPTEVAKFGQMAVCADPGGAAFGLWQAGEMTGAEVVAEPGSLGWTELTTRASAAAKEFYPQVFGWKVRDLSMPEVAYTVWELGDTPVAGMIEMDERWPAEMPAHWMLYFTVEDCDATVGKAERLGGVVSVPPSDIPAGRFAVLDDPYGAFFSVIDANPDYAP